MSTSILEAWWFRLVVRAVLAMLAFLMLRLSADQLRTLSLGQAVDLRFDTSLWLQSIAAVLVGGRYEPLWGLSGRGVLASQARRFFGRGLGIPVLELEEFFEEGVYRSVYKPPLRAGLVSWSVPSFASSAAWTVDPRGDAFRFTWWTYRDEHGERRPNLYRPRVRVTPSSGGRATVGFDSRKDADAEDWVTEPDGKRHQYRGRFLSLSTLGYELSGEDQLTLPQALTLWGIERPASDGPEGLFDELRALRALYEGMLADLSRWPT